MKGCTQQHGPGSKAKECIKSTSCRMSPAVGHHPRNSQSTSKGLNWPVWGVAPSPSGDGQPLGLQDQGGKEGLRRRRGTGAPGVWWADGLQNPGVGGTGQVAGAPATTSWGSGPSQSEAAGRKTEPIWHSQASWVCSATSIPASATSLRPLLPHPPTLNSPSSLPSEPPDARPFPLHVPPPGI